ncbi:MAG: DUF2156 domain-containing protein [Myxococcota bacterium]|nr:DUF2156 domain-containing protein [Myxococcota bacterium]
MTATPESIARAKRLVEAEGRMASAFQILEPGYQYFFGRVDDQDLGVIGYVDTRWYWVVAGGAIGGDAPCTLRQAAAAAKAEGKTLLLVGAEPENVDDVRRCGLEFEALAIGHQPEWVPADYRITGPDRRSLRAQVNRARNKGVRIRRLAPEELTHSVGTLRLQVEHVLAQWMESRRMAVLRFMVDPQPFSFRQERRYYLAETQAGPVGFMAAIPVYGRNGWFFEDVVRVPDAPNGTSELLIHTGLEDAKAQGDAFVTLGLSPLARLDGTFPKHPRLRWLLTWAAPRLSRLYDFRGLERFKGRFHPDTWVPQSMVSISRPLGLRALLALAAVFIPGSFAEFLAETCRRILTRIKAKTWACAVLVQIALLVPWTILLACVDGARWFGDISIHRAWLWFDVGMITALAMLARLTWRRRPIVRRMSMFLSGATLTDFILSLVQAVTLHDNVEGWAALFVTMGVAGPAVATLFLMALAVAWPARGTPE